jgi:hypothetical protein
MTGEIMRRTSCLAVLLLALPAAAQIRLAPLPSSPNAPLSFTSFAPVQALPGQTISVHIEGTGFLPGTTFAIGQPGGVTVLNVTIDNPREAEVMLRVDGNASPGMRPFVVQHGRDRVAARGGFIVLAAQRLPGPVVTQPAAAPPARVALMPTNTAQATTPPQQTVTPKMTVNPAITTNTQQTAVTRQTPGIASGQQVQTQVPISSNMAQNSGQLRLSPAASTVNLSQGGAAPQAGTHSLAGTLASLTLVGPTVNVITPSQLIPGSMNVPVTITGSLFTPGTSVNFDSGIVAQGKAQYINSNKLKVMVNVAAGAQLGAHNVTVANTDRRSAQSQVSVVAIRPRAPIPAVLTIRPRFAILTTPKEGVITLESPIWGQQSGSFGGENKQNLPIPVLDDDTVFSWAEQNHGLAEYYEIRFYARDGKTLLDKRRIEGQSVPVNGAGGKPTNITLPPVTYRPDAALVAELMQKVNPSGTYHANYGQTMTTGAKMSTAAVTGTSGSSGSTPALTVNDGDMQWEVAGFRHYSSPVQRTAVVNAGSLEKASLVPAATLPQNTDNAVEIEVSPRWPLDRANAPKGLTNSYAATTNGLAVINVGSKPNLDASGKPSKNVDPNNYPDDIFMLQGDFDFARSPYAQHPKTIPYPSSQVTNSNTTKNNGTMTGTVVIPDLLAARFDNVFVDWGDGTIQPIEALIAASNVTQWQRGVGLSMSQTIYNQPTLTSSTHTVPNIQVNLTPTQIPAFTHVYHAIGNYQVRVFELAEADAQAINTSSLAMALDESSSSYATGIKLAGFKPQVFRIAASGINFGSAAGSASSSADTSQSMAAIMARGYLLMTVQEVVKAREDLLASGPLNLDSIAISFNEPDQHAAGGAMVEYPAANRTVVVSDVSKVNPSLITAAREGPPAPPSNSPSGPHCSTCDESMVAYATLKYYGKGEARFTWYIDNQPIYSETRPIGPSDQRPNVPDDGKGTPLLKNFQVNSPALNGASLGSHMLHVEAEVIPSWWGFNASLLHNEILEGARTANLSSPAMNTSVNRNITTQIGTGAQVGSLTKVQYSHVFLRMAQSRAGTEQKLGVLSPNRRAAAGVPPVANLQTSLGSLAGTQTLTMPSLPKIKPYYVFSEREQYTVDAASVGVCTFLFTTKDGTFHVTGLQGHVKKNTDGTYSGTGKLVLYLTDSPTSAAQLSPVVVPIDHWQIGADGQTVQKGSFDVSPGLELQALPAVAGKLQRVTATAGAANDLTASLALQLTDSTLTTVDAPQKPPVLSTPQAPLSAPLSSSGDWYKSGVSIPQLNIGWSSFVITPSNAAIDLSRTSGDPVSSVCGSSGASFVGVHLGSATLVPYTMGLAPLSKQVTDWGVSGSGLCGAIDTGPYSAVLDAGKVSFDNLHATAQNGVFTALYKNLTVHVPWLDLDLKADVPLQSGGGQQAAMQFNFPPMAPVTRNYANSSLTVKDFIFTKAYLIGWALYGSTTFNITSENKPFATVADVPVYYAMNGRPYFANQTPSMNVALHGSSSLGVAPLDLVSVRLNTQPAEPNHVLDFDFTTNVHLSTVLPAAVMHVDYGYVRTSTGSGNATYTGSGPRNQPFSVPMVFPAVDPSVTTHIMANYLPGSMAAQDANHNGQSGGGTVFEDDNYDLGLFGGSGIKGSFKLGYGPTGDDYWIALVNANLPPIEIFPPFLTLFAIQGGIGHNVSVDAFSGSSVKNVGYTANTGTVLHAGVTAGSSDDFTYKAPGTVTFAVGSGAGARFDLGGGAQVQSGTLLGGAGNFGGSIQYASHNFDADFGASVHLLGGVLAMGGQNNHASLHYGMDDKKFHLNLGTNTAPLSGTLMGVDGSDVYLMVGNDTGPLIISVGGGQHYHLGVGDDSVASAYVDGHMDVGMTLQVSNPPTVSGEFNAGVSAGVCLVHLCDSAGVNADVKASALPIQMTADASIDFGWPVGSVDFTVSLK